jgi:hypothetical protein
MNVPITSVNNGCCTYVFHFVALGRKFFLKFHSYAMVN